MEAQRSLTPDAGRKAASLLVGSGADPAIAGEGTRFRRPAAAAAFAKTHYREQQEMVQRARALHLQAQRRLGEILAGMPKAKNQHGAPTAAPLREIVASAVEAAAEDLALVRSAGARRQLPAEPPDETRVALPAQGPRSRCDMRPA